MMTDRSVSWTDADSVARLLARATAPRRVVAVARATSARSVKAPTPVRPSTPARPSSPPPPKPTPSALPAPPAKAVVPQLEQPSDNPSDRLDALLAWTLDHQRCNGAFVADDNGLTLAAHGISEAHVSLVGPLLSALVAVRSIPGVDATAGALWLGSNMMSWVEARTERGGFCLGTVGAEALSTEAFNQLKEALELTVRGL
jgi:hypothetical protein